MPDKPESVQWPAIIAYDNDPELDYIESENLWQAQAEGLDSHFEKEDRLIDVTGQVFSLERINSGMVIPLSTGNYLNLSEILGLVKAHLADQGSCCVAKTYAPTIRDAIMMVVNSGELQD